MSKSIDLRQLREDAAAEAAPPVTTTKHKVVEREHSFSITYDAPDGQTYSADLVSRILDGAGRLLRAKVGARLLNGMSSSSMSKDDIARIEALAQVSVQLVDIPEWLDTWVAQDDVLLVQLHSLLMEHEYRYFRGNTPEGANDERVARIRLDSALLKAAGAP